MQRADLLLAVAGLIAAVVTLALWKGAMRKIRAEERPGLKLPPRGRGGSDLPGAAPG